MSATKTVLITGPSSGIGYELAKLLAKDGYRLVLVSSNVEKLSRAAEELKAKYEVPVKVLVKDLSVPESGREVYEDVKKSQIVVDVLVNNAGFGGLGPYHETDWTWEQRMMQLNMISLAELTKFFLKDMVARKSGKILNVASTAAFQPGPLMSIYYATKAFVLSFSEAIAWELKGSGVTVTTLCPGPTATDFGQRAKMEKTFLMSGLFKMTAESVAKVGYKGMLKGKRIVVPGLLNKILVFTVRIMPRFVSLAVVNSVQKEMNAAKK